MPQIIPIKDLDGVDNVYDRLETNPEQFPVSRDAFFAKRGYSRISDGLCDCIRYQV